MIPLTGLNARMGLKLVDATRDRQEQLIRQSPEHKRAIAAFEARIGDIRTVDQLMADRELYVFVMKAHDLEDQIFGKAMIAKILKSDPKDPGSLLNRLTDSRFRELHESMGFREEGRFNVRTYLSSWRREMVDRYVGQRFENAQADQNETVGTVLEFRRKAGSVKNWYDVLKNRELSQFMRGALGVPDRASGLDIDKQVALFEDKFDIAKLKDPAELEKLERRYVAIADARAGVQAQSNAALALMNAAVATGAGGGFAPATIDITAITALRKGY